MRLAPALLLSLTLAAACTGMRAPDGPYAPGPRRGAAAVDGVLVGNRLLLAGEYDLAIDAFTRAALKDGLTPEIMAGIGTAKLGLGRLAQAETLLREAHEKDPTSPEILNNLGVVLVERGLYAEAEQFFRRAYALDNGDSDAIRDNLRLALAKSEDSLYGGTEDRDYKLIRRGSSDYLIRSLP